MSVSQNGWPAFTGWGQEGSIEAFVPGTSVKIQGGLRGGPSATLLLDFASWFHQNIEPLRQAACWGIDIRSIRGSSTTSNHQSGTAMDLNADAHPLGASGTFTAAQAAKIRAKLTEYGGAIRWGGDYNGRKDEMHFEINRPYATVVAVAAKLGTKPVPSTPSTPSKPAPVKPSPSKPTPPVTVPVFPGVTKRGSSGSAVKAVQARLLARGWKSVGSADGAFGANTDATVRAFQREKGLTVDGIVGPATWRALWTASIT